MIGLASRIDCRAEQTRRIHLVRDADTPADQLAQLADDSVDRHELVLIVNHPNCPRRVLNRHVATPGDVLAWLIGWPLHVFGHCLIASWGTDLEVAEAAAAHPNVGRLHLVVAAFNLRPGVRASVASNPSTPRRVLVRLSKRDPDWRVRHTAQRRLGRSSSSRNR
jgi:hypothetical protein